MQCIDLDSNLRQTSPFRFVDEVSFCEDDGLIRSVRLYMGDEEFFVGHFPGDPIVPGVILVESMAQSCRAWLNSQIGAKAEGFIASIDRAKFIKPVRPGDVVIIESKPLNEISELNKGDSRFCRFSCVSKSGGENVAKASLTLFQSN
jgi:3-hydroxyacyl-[acyl-carrier-protein] dehydratase